MDPLGAKRTPRQRLYTGPKAERNRREAIVGAPDFYKMCRSGTEVLQLCGKSLRELAKPSSYGEPKVIGAFLLQPHVARVIVGEFHNQHALVFG
jgi:hypothetical protein